MKLWEDPRVAEGLKAQLAKRRARIAAGEKPLGWKLGLGAPAALARAKIPASVIGFLMQSGLLPSGATAEVKGWIQPVAEPEIAVRLKNDVAPGSTAQAARAAIASLTPAIELADLDPAPIPENLTAILAGNLYQRHVVLSERSRAGGDTAGLSSEVFRRGELAGQSSDPEALTGKLPDLLVHLADTLGAFGERLAAGDLVICGSITPPPLIEPDEVDFSYTLRPIGEVSVRFSR
jgi:2-keto-4-pentenoate hydratase